MLGPGSLWDIAELVGLQPLEEDITFGEQEEAAPEQE